MWFEETSTATTSVRVHPKIMLASKHITFYKSLLNSSKLSVRFISRLNEMTKEMILAEPYGES